jgi:hypothetical protein
MHQNLQAAKTRKKLAQIVDKGHPESMEYGRSVAKKTPPSKEGRWAGSISKSGEVIDPSILFHCRHILPELIPVARSRFPIALIVTNVSRFSQIAPTSGLFCNTQNERKLSQNAR